jgi:protocatechuate 3,4-dioxygenase beta subunit
VKVQAPGGSILTTQLFFPGVDQNQSDGIFNSSLLMVVQNNSKGEKATFNFILNP